MKVQGLGGGALHSLEDMCAHAGQPKTLKCFTIDFLNPPAFSPHKIDVALLSIIPLNSIASCMIKAKSLHPTLEFEAISSATHILNKSPHNALASKTPFEAWCERKPIVTHFRVFDCPTWANRSSGDARHNHLDLVLSFVMKMV